VERIDARTFKIILTQGLNRQIRRMTEALGYEVVALKRTRIMHITLEGIAPGKWRYFTPSELNKVLELVEKSSKTEEASRVYDDEE
jgi:23S rRNA pseudouridine2604 synthase